MNRAAWPSRACVPAFAALIALVAAGGSTSALGADDDEVRWTLGRLRLALGPEVDTNARRAVQGADVEDATVPFPVANRPSEVVLDGLIRAIVDASAGLRFGRDHALRGYYVLGAKRFFQETTEDLLAQEVGLASGHRLGSVFRLDLDGSYKGSRIRSGLRDYDVLTAGLGGTFIVSPSWQVDLQTRMTRFTFAIEPRFNYLGPRATLGLTYRPTRRLSVAVRGGATVRLYDGQALVEGIFVGTTEMPIGTPVLRFCEDPDAELEDGILCEPAGKRQDIEVTASASVSYRGPFLISAQYLLRLQRSNSDVENIDRHRVEVTATFALPGSLTMNVLGALQFNQGVSITDQKFLADDDENQNSLNVGVQRPIYGPLYVEARYALFANQFSTADVEFIRHTAYLGLGYREDFTDD